MAVKTSKKASTGGAASAVRAKASAASAVRMGASQSGIQVKGTNASTSRQADPIGNATVTCASLNVRSGAGVNFPRIGGLTQGRSVEVYEEKDGWLKVKYGSDYGWISKTYTNYKAKDPVTEPSKPENPKFESFQAKVSGVSSLWVRSGPSTNYETVKALSEGTVVTVVGQDPTTGWYQIQYGEISGWMSNKYLEKVTGGTTQPEQPQQPSGSEFEVVVTNCNNLNMRTGPGTNYEQIGQIPCGTHVMVSEEKNGWYHVKYDGKEGWISGDYTYKPGEVSAAGQKAADKARELYTKYVAEGWTYSQTYRSSTGHYDCSYFTHTCWLAGGVNFNGTTAAGQAERCAKAGGEISGKNNIQPGDLLFWANGNNGRYRNISHVAIAVGNGKRIDAGSTPVREDSVGSPMMIGRPSVLLK